MNTCESSKPLRVIIAHASVGSGHKTAAIAISQALQSLNDNNENGCEQKIETKVVDILDYGRIKFDGNAFASSFTGAARPFYDLTWRYTFTGRLLWGGGTSWSRVIFPKFTQFVRDYKPDAIVCTHITAANVAVGAKLICKETYPIICAPTDYEVEGLWPHKYCNLFCVANEQMAETLRARKIVEDKIKITGIPTSLDFNKKTDEVKTRDEFNLPHDKQIVVIQAGASLPRPYVHLRKVVFELLPYINQFKDLHFAIISGKDSEFENELKRQLDSLGVMNTSVFGYVNNMADLMNASNLIVCKAGGMTVTECLCAGKPMILTCRAYGQEKANVKMLTAAGAATHVTTARELFDALKLVNENHDALDGVKYGALILRKPHAAVDIAKETINLAISPDQENIAKKHFLTLMWGKKPARPR